VPQKIRGVMKRGGRVLVSHSLINAATSKSMAAKKTLFTFGYGDGPCHLLDRGRPDEGVAYDEPYAFDLFAANRFQIRWPVHYGNWRERRSYKITQDWVVGVRI
jgi:hypothetical protein